MLHKWTKASRCFLPTCIHQSHIGGSCSSRKELRRRCKRSSCSCSLAITRHPTNRRSSGRNCSSRHCHFRQTRDSRCICSWPGKKYTTKLYITIAFEIVYYLVPWILGAPCSDVHIIGRWTARTRRTIISRTVSATVRGSGVQSFLHSSTGEGIGRQKSQKSDEKGVHVRYEMIV